MPVDRVSVPAVNRMIEMESSRMKIRNMRSQPAKMPGFRSGMVMRLSVVAQEAPTRRELCSSSSETASMTEATFRCP